MIDLVWCEVCSRLWVRSDLKAENGCLLCPECGRKLPTYRMAIFECPQCHRKILYMPDTESRIVCDCERTSEELPVGEAPEEYDRDSDPAPDSEKEPGEADHYPDTDEPAIDNICWRSPSDMDVAYAPPRGKRIRYGDTLMLEDRQAACFSCGGKLLWVRGPAIRTVGYDSRDPDEILRAYQYGEDTGLPPMINTSIVIYDLRERRGVTGEPASPVILAGRLGFLPAFRFDLAIETPERLRSVLFVNEVPTLKELTEHIVLQLTRELAKRVERCIPESGTLAEAESAARERLEVCLASAVKEDPPGSDWGLRVSGVQLTGCTFFPHFCPVCHQPVRSKAAECDNGHPLRWCPVCGEIQDQGVCVNGHLFRFCRLCGREILTTGGKCPRHGSLGINK